MSLIPNYGSGTDINKTVEEPKDIVMLAHKFDPDKIDPTGWWMSEKLDGMRAIWRPDLRMLLTRNGKQIFAPEWFLAGLPPILLDGELWIGRKTFQAVVSICRKHNPSEEWRQVSYMVFDTPRAGEFESRMLQLLRLPVSSVYHVLPQERCSCPEHLTDHFLQITQQGGEGVMLRRPNSPYLRKRSRDMLKVKSFDDSDGIVVAHIPGLGKHAGRLGALQVQLDDGTLVCVGTGLSDAERESPPPIGSKINFTHQGVSTDGVPRFPSFKMVRT